MDRTRLQCSFPICQSGPRPQGPFEYQLCFRQRSEEQSFLPRDARHFSGTTMMLRISAHRSCKFPSFNAQSGCLYNSCLKEVSTLRPLQDESWY